MSELNKNKYLDFSGLQTYDGLIKGLIESNRQQLAASISELNAKIGNLDVEGSDDKTLADIVSDIYASIDGILAKQGKLDEKDAEIEAKITEEIAKVVGDSEEMDEGVTLMTLVEIANNLKSISDSVSKNTQDITDVTNRVTAVEEAVEKLGDLGDGNTLGDLVSDITKNTQAIEILTGEGEGSVKKAAADAQTAAEATAAADATSKANAAETAAKGYADSLVKDAEGKSLFDEVGAAAQALADAKADAASLYQVKGDYEAAGAAAQALDDAKEYAEKLTNIYAAAGSAADALDDAKEYADGLAGANASAISGLTDRIGTLEGLSYASDVKYEDGYINLYDATGAKIGAGFDASPFIVDGMLESVEFVDDSDSDALNTTLRFTFNTDGGKREIDVDFSDYVDTYHGDNSSITLDSNTNTFSVKEVAATKTKTVATIPVAGGPLEDLLKNAGITEIAAGSSIEDVLFSLICKELWAKTLTFSEGTVASSISQPTFTLTNSGKTVEVGTKCTLSDITMGAATPSVSKNRTYSGFTYGYSESNNNTQESTNTSITAGIDVAAALNEGNYTMTRDYTQFNGASDDSATANADASQVKLSGAELTVSYVGANSVKVTVGGPTASATFASMPVYYACSNLKKTKDAAKDSEGQYKSDAKDAKKVTSSAASNSKTLTVTGARAFWTGSVKTALTEFTSATVRAAGESNDNHLNVTLGTSVPATITAKGGDAQVIIATQKEVTKVTSENQINADVFGNFTHRSITIEGANGFTGISYHVYEWTPANPFAKDDKLTITYK